MGQETGAAWPGILSTSPIHPPRPESGFGPACGAFGASIWEAASMYSRSASRISPMVSVIVVWLAIPAHPTARNLIHLEPKRLRSKLHFLLHLVGVHLVRKQRRASSALKYCTK